MKKRKDRGKDKSKLSHSKNTSKIVVFRWRFRSLWPRLLPRRYLRSRFFNTLPCDLGRLARNSIKSRNKLKRLRKKLKLKTHRNKQLHYHYSNKNQELYSNLLRVMLRKILQRLFKREQLLLNRTLHKIKLLQRNEEILLD